jgi:sulfotransferase
MKLYFLSGLPRTGTTLLSSILNQNSNIHSTSTSSLLDFLSGVDYVYNEVQQRHRSADNRQLKNIFKSIISSYYSHLSVPYVIDKWRGWMNNIPQIQEIIVSNPKIICTYRPIEEIITSFLFLLEKDPNNFIDIELKKRKLECNNLNRSIYLWEEGVVGESYRFFQESLNYKKCLYISYNEIVTFPNDTMNKIYDYLEIEIYPHNFKEIKSTSDDNDDYWQLKNLHQIRSEIKHCSPNPKKYLTPKLINYFKQYNKIFDYV